jgi:hypothetical protein
MTGAFDSVLGVNKEKVLMRFLTQVPQHFEVAEKDIRLQGVVVEVEKTGKSISIKRIMERKEGER